MIYLFLATGFEEIEAVTTLDILRRLGLEVKTVSITGTRLITGAHGIAVMADSLFRKKDIELADVLILPGGMPGVKNLQSCENLNKALVQHFKKGKLVAAICAAPMLLGELGILAGRKATCYPGFENYLKDAVYCQDLVVRDYNVITGKGPGAAAQFAFEIASALLSEGKIERVKYETML